MPVRRLRVSHAKTAAEAAHHTERPRLVRASAQHSLKSHAKSVRTVLARIARCAEAAKTAVVTGAQRVALHASHVTELPVRSAVHSVTATSVQHVVRLTVTTAHLAVILIAMIVHVVRLVTATIVLVVTLIRTVLLAVHSVTATIAHVVRSKSVMAAAQTA